MANDSINTLLNSDMCKQQLRMNTCHRGCAVLTRPDMLLGI